MIITETVKSKMKKVVVLAALLLSVALAGCAGPFDYTAPVPTAGNVGVPQKQPTAEANGPKAVKFGGSAEFTTVDRSGTVVVTLGAPREDPNAQVDLPADGKYVFLAAKADLIGGFVATIGDDEFTLVDANGKRYEAAPTSVDAKGPFIEFLTDEERTADGVILYDVPPDTDLHSLKVEWQPTDDNRKPLGLAATWSA